MLSRYLFNVPKKFKILGCTITTQQMNEPMEIEKNTTQLINLIVNLPIYHYLTRYLNNNPSQYSVVALMQHNKEDKKYPYIMEISDSDKSIGFLRFIQKPEPTFLC